MRVLIVQPNMPVYGGADRVIVKLANYLTKKGIENAVLTLTMSPEIRKDLEKTRIIIPKEIPKRRNKGFLNFINEILILRKYVHKNINSFDVINVHNFPAELSVFPHVKPTVWMCNEPPELYLKPNPSLPLKMLQMTGMAIDKFVVKNYIKYVCVAEFNAERIKKKYNIMPEINNYGIDSAFFSKGNGERAKKMFNLHENFVVLHVGILTPFKNQMESIKTVEKIKNKIPNVKLVLAGWAGWEKSEYETMLQRYVHAKSLDQQVVFTGHVSRDVVRDLYQACDVVLFPFKPQGGWLAPFEALCAGKPIVASSVTTTAGIIKREKIGIVTDNFDKAVMDIYTDPTKYHDMAERGRVWVEKNLGWGKFCQKMLELFEKAL